MQRLNNYCKIFKTNENISLFIKLTKVYTHTTKDSAVKCIDLFYLFTF